MGDFKGERRAPVYSVEREGGRGRQAERENLTLNSDQPAVAAFVGLSADSCNYPREESRGAVIQVLRARDCECGAKSRRFFFCFPRVKE